MVDIDHIEKKKDESVGPPADPPPSALASSHSPWVCKSLAPTPSLPHYLQAKPSSSSAPTTLTPPPLLPPPLPPRRFLLRRRRPYAGRPPFIRVLPLPASLAPASTALDQHQQPREKNPISI
ncbi:hypothetical protein AAC387_Pa01g1945 [Persea americana]